MRMKIATIALAILLIAACPFALPVVAVEGETDITGAGDGVFPVGASLNAVSLSGSEFGVGVIVYPDGSALGQFQSLLLGTSALGQPQNISLNGTVTAGTADADGSVTFRGTCILDMGDGTLPLPDVPFIVTLAPSGALTLAIGATTLPAQTLVAGSVTIE